MDINLIVSILSLAVAVVVFVITELESRKATIEQTKQENIRATLTDFSALRREHQNFDQEMRDAVDDVDKRRATMRDYLADLERFSVGINRDAYDLEVVSSMSGGMLVRQYRKYFREHIGQRRRNTSLTSTVKREALYSEYEQMMQKLCTLRGEEWQPVDAISEEQWILEQFLRMPISGTDAIFKLFRTLPGAIEAHGEGKQGYLFVPGTRADRCVLAAHADTFFDAAWQDGAEFSNDIVFEDGVYRGTASDCSIGADDRCGCAMLWALRKSGHSLLLLDGEEHGQVGAHYLAEHDPELLALLQQHSFILQLDRRNASDYKTYALPVSSAFTDFIESATGFAAAGDKGRTDIIVLCTQVCGANLSVGYYDEHKPGEHVVYAEWLHTLDVVRRMIAKPLRRFPLEG